MRVWLVIAACACGGKPTAGHTDVKPPIVGAKTCEDVRPRVEELYRGEKQALDFVADNTTMVMNDCAKSPALVACLARASTIAELERQCLIPIDDEGTEGRYLQAKDVSRP